jgi:cytochrome c553
MKPTPNAKPRVPVRPGSSLMAGLILLSLLPTGAWAADQQRLRTRVLAATCAQCHGTDGRAVEGQAMVRLAGLPKDYALTQLLAFRTGQRPATVMHQITRGYSPAQLDELATYFAAQQ